MQELIKRWRVNLDCLKNRLYDLGAKGESLEYNILAAEAMAISECIIDTQAQMIDSGMIPTLKTSNQQLLTDIGGVQ